MPYGGACSEKTGGLPRQEHIGPKAREVASWLYDNTLTDEEKTCAGCGSSVKCLFETWGE